MRFRMLRQKPTRILTQKLLKEATIHFYCLFDASRFSDICTIMELKYLNSLCKPMENVRSSQPCISWIFALKTSFSLWVSLRRFYTRQNVSRMSRRHRFFLLWHMHKSFVYWHFPEMSTPLKSTNYFKFFAPKNCRFLFKPIVFVY